MWHVQINANISGPSEQTMPRETRWPKITINISPSYLFHLLTQDLVIFLGVSNLCVSNLCQEVALPRYKYSSRNLTKLVLPFKRILNCQVHIWLARATAICHHFQPKVGAERGTNGCNQDPCVSVKITTVYVYSRCWYSAQIRCGDAGIWDCILKIGHETCKDLYSDLHVYHQVMQHL